MTINTKILRELKPCKDRLENWLLHYKDFEGDFIEFLELEKLTPQDKVWVAVRVLPRELLEVFVIDCASRALLYGDTAYTAAAYTASASAADYASASASAAAYTAYAYAAAYTAAAYTAYAYAAAYTASASAADTADTEREHQIDALVMLYEAA